MTLKAGGINVNRVDQGPALMELTAASLRKSHRSTDLGLALLFTMDYNSV